MPAFGAFEAKNRLGHLLDLVEQGEEVTITRHGKAVARLVPPQKASDRAAAREAVGRMRARAAALRAGPFDWEEWKSFRDQGRR